MKKILFSLLIIIFCALNGFAQSNALTWYKGLPREWQKALLHNKCNVESAATIKQFLDTTSHFTLYFEVENGDAKHEVQDFKPLLKFKKLTKLYANEISVGSYADLRCMPKLTVLEVQTSGFSDKDMVFLKKMKSLQRLNIAQTSISSLVPLSGLRNLAFVLCMETNIPREKIAEYARLLPKECRIVRDYTF
jgi:hypothetical protein